MRLWDADEKSEYMIKSILCEDAEMESFLFSLGCYSGECIALISKLKKSCVVLIKGAKYNIDAQLASSIIVC